MAITFKETFQFANAADLRDFLNQFKTTDLETVNLQKSNGDEGISILYETESLTDGSEVNNITVF